MASYIGTRLKTDITIGKLYSVHHFEYPQNFKYEGERHNFWEVVYADKGDITVIREDESFLLKQGNIVFHKPNEWHGLRADNNVAVNLVVFSFECVSPAMEFFCKKALTVGQEQRTIISKILSEYTNAFKTPFNNPYTTRILRKKNPVIGSQQLLGQYISELLISFLRQTEPTLPRSQTSINRESALLNTIVNYMLDHITENITIDDLVRYSGSNKTTISSAFKNNLGMSTMEYFISLKIDLAKKHLREDNYNISQISDILGYSGIHYFSRQFKKVTGMTPTEYSSSIQAIVKNSH